MKASISWLKSLCPADISDDELVSRLTMAGLEVDAIEPASNIFSQVVVGEVVSVSPHPDADKLNVCEVTDGSETFQVVCGAANVRTGLKAPFAKVGGQVGPDFQIKEAKLRGVVSQGMLCGADELGLSDERDGLMELASDAPVGESLDRYLGLPDAIVEVDLTPNRGDCLSITGLARELSVLTETTFNAVPCDAVSPVVDDRFKVRLMAPEGCPVYVGRVIKGVDITAPTPLWMVERLRRSGLRSIDAVVDITNYVMLELGQPMHAFDLAQLSQEVQVRFASSGETLTLLDGKELTLGDDILVIADAEKPLALAGIMGGEHSGISESTRDVFLESAFFDPIVIAGKARRFGLHTDASARFERGVDWQLAERASERATALLVEICGGQPGPRVTTEEPAYLPAIREVELTHSRLRQQLRIDLPASQVSGMLEALGCEVAETTQGFCCKAPSWRFDLSIEQDLVEEVARIYGYNNLPVSLPAQAVSMAPVPEAETPVSRLKHYLVDQDLQEVITYSFVAPESQAMLGDGQVGVRLANPIASNMAEMRRSLFPGLVDAVRHNVNRQASRVRVFEMGQCFVGTDAGLDQSERLGLALYGQVDPVHFQGARDVDFFDLKGLISGVSQLNGGPEITWTPATHPALAPGQTAELSVDGQVIGVAGRLHPKWAKSLDLPKPLYLMDAKLAPFLSGQVTAFKAISRYPRVSRDLAVLVNKAITWADVRSAVASVDDSRIRDVQLFDVYQGPGVSQGMQSLALTVSLQDTESTLDEAAIQEVIEAVVSVLKTKLNAELRG